MAELIGIDLLVGGLKLLRRARDWVETRELQLDVDVSPLRPIPVISQEPPPVTPIGPSKRKRRPRKTSRPPPGRSRSTFKVSEAQAIPLKLIDERAIDIVKRLRQYGYRGYLVGGCVRDLLLDLEPKDFDIATNASPEEAKALFRNSRIIGRRFRLLHVYFRGGKIFEVSTFRAQAKPVAEGETGEEDSEDLLIRRDNVFGTEVEDAMRRDFTVNGLFYDIGTGSIIDHVDGLRDLRARRLRMIGDPDIRLREDPVRILRAVRLSAKTGLAIDEDLEGAVARHCSEVARCAPARVFEETLKLLRGGYSELTFEKMERTSVLDLLFPELARLVQTPSHRQTQLAQLRALDEVVKTEMVSDAVVLAAVFYPAYSIATLGEPQHYRDRGRLTSEFLRDVGSELLLTRKLSEQVRQMFMMQRHLDPEERTEGKRSRRRAAPSTIARRVHFPDALQLLEIRTRAAGQALDDVERWKARLSPPSPHRRDKGDEPRRSSGNRKGRSRRRTRR